MVTTSTALFVNANIHSFPAISYNQPKFCSNPSWNPNGITFADSRISGLSPWDIFINTNNTVYVANHEKGAIVVWSEGSTTPTRNISGNLLNPIGLFVTTSGDILIDAYDSIRGVSKWTLNLTSGVPIMYTCQKCQDLFVDISNTLYCSMGDLHQVVTKSLISGSNAFKIIAGAGTSGSALNMLNQPHGIFVDINFDLYVADFINNRVQLFRLGQLNGITVAGSGSSATTITLYLPTGIVLDADKYLYIVDFGRHRIVGSGSSGFRCLVGCSGLGGSGPNQLYEPIYLSFDSYGNMFVTDRRNSRIQKFLLSTNLCSETTAEETVTSITSTVEISTPVSPNIATKNPLKIVSYNQPKFSAYATWGPNAITFATGSTIGPQPYGIFINTKNTIYVVDRANGRIQIWLDDNANLTKTLSGNLSIPYSIFVTNDDAIYVDNGNLTGRLDKWSLSTNTSVVAMYVGQKCFGLFVDINDILYCSMRDLHQVVTKSLDSVSDMLTIVAGVGCAGSTSNMLSSPYQIFVNINFDLYVADCGNNRIQLFEFNQLNGKTIAGNGAAETIPLNCPTGIVLNIDNYLFIVDSLNHRIVGSGPNGFRCLIGCYGSGLGSNTLLNPQSMAFDNNGNIFVTDSKNNRVQKFILFNNTLARSYNQPKFCSSTSWNSDAITFATEIIVGAQPAGIFVNSNNTVYVTDRANSRIHIWFNNSINPTRIITGNLLNPGSIFVATNGDIYVDYTTRVDKWTLITNTIVVAMYADVACGSLFVDISNTLYCTLSARHQVVKRWLGDNATTLTTVAGTGTLGSASNMLHQPFGIFVDINFDLYVADNNNNRIQLFRLGQLNGITVAGSGSITTTITLSQPSGIVLDADKYLFIVEFGRHRIVGSGPTGFRCLVGCSGLGGVASNQLTQPLSLSFDSYGNMFVTDMGNRRVQKFVLSTNSCDVTTVQATTQIQKDQTTTDIMQTTRTQSITETRKEEIISTAIQTTFAETTTRSTQKEEITSTAIQTTFAETTTRSTQKEEITSTAIQTAFVETTTRSSRKEEISSTAIQTTFAETTTRSTRKEEITSIEPHPSTMLVTSEMSIINQTCFSPIIRLIPGTSYLTSPIQFRRNQDFYISSDIEFNCNNSFLLMTKWTIKTCSLICLYEIRLDPTIIETKFSELYIPSRTLSYGIYELQLIVTMITSSNLISSASAFVKIIPSGITANLIELGTSMITRGEQQELKLDPGTYSVDLDVYTFDVKKWEYEYYCRIYGLYNFPKLNSSLLTINDPRIDSSNPSCLSNRSNNEPKWKFGDTSKSSLTILADSLQSNRTYQFIVHMKNIQNSSFRITGYVLVKVEDSRPPMILIGCVISTMCIPNLEFQLVNPTTQVALFSICNGNCTDVQNMTWNIYRGSRNLSLDIIKWNLFDQMNLDENSWFFGRNTSNFTALNQLFLLNKETTFWRFEVVYTFPLETSASALDFIINQPPSNGSCEINPRNGTTNILFTITCLDWFDDDNIRDYSLYISTNNPIKRLLIAFSSISDFQVRLPAGKLDLVIHIRDTLDCITKFNLSSINVELDSIEIINNSIIQLLSSGNQNTVGQIIISISQQLNKMNNENINKAVSNGIPASTISISPLRSQSLQKNSMQLNMSALDEYNKELNSHANLRESLMSFATNLAITTVNSIKLQATILAQLTQATNQLTRKTLMLATERCHQLTIALKSISRRIPYEDAQIAATQLIQCATNVLTAVNGPLQKRTKVLDVDFSRATKFQDDYDTDLEFEWSNPNLFADGNDFSWETISKGQNIYYQKKLSNQILIQTTEMISLLTSILNIHLNIGQNLIINTSEVFMSLETITVNLLSNKKIYIPTNINSNKKISIRTIMEPLALFGNSTSSSNTNLSRSISLSILDQNGNEISIKTNENDSIEIIIPRDPNLIIPPMILQNITSIPHNQTFNIQYVNITSILPISVHFQIHPLDTNISYLFIYKFDQVPQLNNLINQIDGWTLLCTLNNENLYTYFVDNQQTEGHRSLFFGLREIDNCSITSLSITNEKFHFTSDYELRIYTSGCYYLDKNNQWKSDGLRVGSETNLHQTQCFSKHLTTFTSGLQILPESINWNYVFANADFEKTKTIYLTVILVLTIYIILIIYARYRDKKYFEKLGVTPLSDNHKSDHYYYQIIVFTGQRKDFGTKSKVHFVLSGNNNKTNIRTFHDPHREIFQRGRINSFCR